VSQPSVAANRSYLAFAIPVLAGAFATLGGIVSLLGWILNAPRLADWNGDGITIKPNPAICILLLSMALLCCAFRPSLQWLIRILAAGAAAISLLTLFEHFSGIDLGIDTLLFYEPPGMPSTASPGRMGIPAASMISIIGIGMILKTVSDTGRHWASIMATLAFAISSLSLTGYLFGADQLYAIPHYTGIALQTASMLAALGIGLAAAVPEYGFISVMSRPDSGGVVLRRLTIPLVVLALVLGWLRVLGQNAGLYDTAFGTAVRTLMEITILLGLLWWTARDISRSEERAREAAVALADRDERMHGVLESLSDAFISFDADLRITYANASLINMLALYDIDGTKVFGKRPDEVMPEIGSTSLGKALIESMTERRAIDLEDYFPPFDRWFHARYLPTRDGGVSLFALDITEQKKGEQLLTKRANELGVLYEFADQLNRSVSIDEVYESALQTITKALGCERASILLFDDAGVMSFVASRGLSEGYKKAVTGHSPWKQGEKGAKPMGIPDIEASDTEPELKDTIMAEGIRALGFIPLISNEELIGKFMVYYDQPHEFTPDEFEIAMTVGYQIAIGVERMQTEQALRENEERLRLATQTGKVGVWDWDIRGDHVAWTPSVYEMHGVRPGEFDGSIDAFSRFVHPDDQSYVMSRIEAALANEAPYEIEFRVQKQTGDVAWLFTNGMVLRDSNGPFRMIGATIDVTDRKMAEQELAKAAAIVDSSLDAIVSKDVNGIIQSWNSGAEKIFGFRSDEVIGKSIKIIIPEDRYHEEENILERVHRGLPTSHYETQRKRKDGSLIDISLSVSPVRDANGVIIGASKIARDITESKRAELAVREREMMGRLVDAQEAERHRIARDLHDHMGQQLTALRLKLASLRSKFGSDPELANEIALTQEYASRIDMDINYLAWELRPTELDQLGLTDALRSFVREWSKTYGIAADFHTSKDHNARYEAELETNVYRIVQEGLNNILKHADASNVSVLLEQRDDLLVLIIEDDGKGFDPESGRRNGASGKGLGLVGMRERTALLGGALEIESRPGEGTTVYARVPVRASERNGDNGTELPAEM
jgi:PAS domain S-box-containing protein